MEPLSPAFSFLTADEFSPLGESPVLVYDLAEPDAETRASGFLASQAILIGIDRAGTLACANPDIFDLVLTSAPDAPRPWVSETPDKLEQLLDRLIRNAKANPIATSVLKQVLRMNETMSVSDALLLESFAYSSLLGGEEFRNWRSNNPPEKAPTIQAGEALVKIDRQGETIHLRLNSPTTRNAMSAGMRNAFYNALALAMDDETTPKVSLSAEGPCFSIGGDLNEFGSATDLAAAHTIRTLQSCAGLLFRLGERASVTVHGACIGSGLEIPVAAGNCVAQPGTIIQLPELSMGLIPGAGGTVSISRRIGRHRTFWLALYGRRLRADALTNWGLFDAAS